MEFQSRGSQHFHILFYPGCDETSPFEVSDEIKYRWSKVVGDSDRYFLENGTKVDRIQNLRGCKFYMSLHHTKKDQNRTDIDTGRCWGIVGRRHLPESLGEHFFVLHENRLSRNVSRISSLRKNRIRKHRKYRKV